MKKAIVMGISLMLTPHLKAQSILDNYVRIGFEANQQYIKEQLDTKIATTESKIAKSLFLPDVSFQTSYTLSDGGRTIDFPVGDLFNPVYNSLNDLNGSNEFPTNLENLEMNLLPNNFHETKIRVIQPILNTDLFYSYKAKQKLVNVNQAKEDAYRNQLEFQIKKAYYNHLQLLEQKTILDSTRELVKELVRVNGKFVKYDVATKDVLYNAEAQLYQIKADLATVQKNIKTSRIFFNFLLNRNLEEEILVDNEIEILQNIYNIEELQSSGITNRSELIQIENAIEANTYQIKKDQSFLIPKLSVAVEAGYQGNYYKFNNDQQYSLVSFNLSVPIFQGGRNRTSIKQSRLKKEAFEVDYTQLKQNITLEVSKAYYEFEETIEVYQAKSAQLKSAQENFRILEAKYRQNQVLLVEYNESRTNLTTASLNESIARYNIKIADANVKRAAQIQ